MRIVFNRPTVLQFYRVCQFTGARTRIGPERYFSADADLKNVDSWVMDERYRGEVAEIRLIGEEGVAFVDPRYVREVQGVDGQVVWKLPENDASNVT